MGTLVAMRYPTRLALGAADHTYVKCANEGRAWKCWGGKTGGTELKRGSGSTTRADAIAEPDEKANIRCYLVNGVCHQSANRILSVADLTVQGARGYFISHYRYDTYGRPRATFPFHKCVADFHEHLDVSGDLPLCAETDVPGVEDQHATYGSGGSPRDRDQAYLAQVKELYRQRTATLGAASSVDGEELVEFMVTLFSLRLEFSGVSLGGLQGKLKDLRAGVERRQIELEESVGRKKVPMYRYPEESDRLTLDAQKELAGVLDDATYFALFELKPGDFVKLGDPDIVQVAYGRPGAR